MKEYKLKELNEKVALLKDGQVVEIAGDSFQAVRVDELDGFSCCQLCELDSICRGEVVLVCSELDRPFSNKWYLKLAHP